MISWPKLLFAVCSCALATVCTLNVFKKRDFSDYTVHVVFSNHLDVGFTDLDNAVIDLYFHKHYPAAIELAKQLRESPDNPHNDTFKYLTHSWLLSLLFDCPPGLGVTCPNASEVEAVKQAIQDGIITWHAAPFNPQYEVFDADLLGAAIDLTHSIDDHFNLPRKAMVSLRDVPGLTRAAIPVLVSKGVHGITGGVNGFSAPPGVPKTTPFVWRDEESGTELLAMWHPGVHGITVGVNGGSAPPGVPKTTPFVWRDEESDTELLAMWHPGGYAGHVNTTEIDTRHDCIAAKGFKHVLCASWGSDNFGPPASLDELQKMFAIVRDEWPGAQVMASTLDDYLSHLKHSVKKGLKLPVVTGEIGDTWVHGIASDPARMADYRAALRARRECLRQHNNNKHCDAKSYAFLNFTRLLVKVPEHTWGISFNAYFGEWGNYSNAWLHELLAAGEGAHRGLAVSVESWRRQRQYVDWALEALPEEHPIRKAVAADRDARQHAHKRLDEEQLTELGATAVLQHEPQQSSMTETAASTATQHDCDGQDSGPSSSSTSGLSSAVREGDSVCRADNKQLLFCSKYWLIQVDSRTGGLSRLQRLHGKGSKRTAGNDWAAAAAAAKPKCTDLPTAAAISEAAVITTKRKLLINSNTGADPIQTIRDHSTVRSQTLDKQQQQQPALAQASDHNRHRKKSHHAAFAQLQYNVYNLDDYQFVWDNYAYIHPVWVGDFGKFNMSATSNLSAEAQAKLEQVYHVQNDKHGLMLHLKLSFPNHLVREAGAPAAAWLVIHSPPQDHQLHLTLVWQNKTVTRLPEAMWLRFKPGRGAVDKHSWTMQKLNSNVKPQQIIRNGSHSIHAVSRGVSVKSRDGKEKLHIETLDVPLVNVGKPNPFYNNCDGPDMSEGVSFNMVNTIWGTNYAMWLYNPEDANMAFRFVLDAERR